MNKKQLYGKYYKKLLVEALIRSLVAGIIVGCGAQFIGALIGWFTPWIHGRTWIVLGVALATMVIATLLFYFLLYRPTEEKIARRIDRLGFEERFVTMRELEGDDSFIARTQREDTLRVARESQELLPKIVVSMGMIIAVSVMFVFGTGMHVVTGLSEYGHVRTGEEVINRIKGDTFYEVIYEVSEETPGGYIEGDILQLVLPGGETSRVVAIADDGWQFKQWSDGLTDPVRYDVNVTQDTLFLAEFVPIEPSDDGDGDGDADADEDLEQPPEENQDNNQSQGGQTGDPDDYATGQYVPGNNVIDGETYYREVLQQYYDEAMKILAEGGDIPDDLRAILEAYYDIIL